MYFVLEVVLDAVKDLEEVASGGLVGLVPEEVEEDVAFLSIAS